MYAEMSTPHVGGRRRNLTDLPPIHCGTQGTLLHVSESRFPHREPDGYPRGRWSKRGDAEAAAAASASPWRRAPNACSPASHFPGAPPLRGQEGRLRHTPNVSRYLPLERPAPWALRATPCQPGRICASSLAPNPKSDPATPERQGLRMPGAPGSSRWVGLWEEEMET